MTPITLKMVNIEDLSAAHGLEYFFSGLGYVPGPFVAGWLSIIILHGYVASRFHVVQFVLYNFIVS